jgi:hypothetical protein
MGLYRKGHEVRGWRTAAMRLPTNQAIAPSVAITSSAAVAVKSPSVERITP